jgi:hypothetical protein
MIYEREINSKKTEIHIIVDCIKCGKDDLYLNEYEDNYGFISTIRCNKKCCNNELKQNTTMVSIIKAWNKLKNSWHYDRKYKMLVKAQELAVADFIEWFKNQPEYMQITDMSLTEYYTKSITNKI